MLLKFFELVCLFGVFYLSWLSFLSFINFHALKLNPLEYTKTGFIFLIAAGIYLIVYIILHIKGKKEQNKTIVVVKEEEKEMNDGLEMKIDLEEPFIDKKSKINQEKE